MVIDGGYSSTVEPRIVIPIDVGSNPTSHPKSFCPGGGMVDTLVLETSAERREGSNPSWGTKNMRV